MNEHWLIVGLKSQHDFLKTQGFVWKHLHKTHELAIDTISKTLNCQILSVEVSKSGDNILVTCYSTHRFYMGVYRLNHE